MTGVGLTLNGRRAVALKYNILNDKYTVRLTDGAWRREGGGNAARWRYLGAMRDEDFAKVFAVDITGATLGEIAEALAEGFERVVAASEKREASESRDGDVATRARAPRRRRGRREDVLDATRTFLVASSTALRVGKGRARATPTS